MAGADRGFSSWPLALSAEGFPIEILLALDVMPA